MLSRSTVTLGLALAAAAAISSASCTRRGPVGAPLSVSAVGSSTRVDIQQPPTEDPQVFVRTENVVRLPAVINGVVAFQLVLSAEHGPSVGVELSAEDLRGLAGVIPRQAVQLYRQWPITIDRYPNWYLRSQGPRQARDVLDVLVPVDAPRGGQPFVIPPGSRLPIWVEIRIPADARPGTYQGGVIARDADARVMRTPVEIVVYDVYLSPNDALPVLARVQLAPVIAAQTRFDPQNLKLALADEEARRILTQAFVVLQEHGLSPYTDDVRPLAWHAADGSVQFDWSVYDAFCGPLIDGTAYGGVLNEPAPSIEQPALPPMPTTAPAARVEPSETEVPSAKPAPPATASAPATAELATSEPATSEPAEIEVFLPEWRHARQSVLLNQFFDNFPPIVGRAESSIPASCPSIGGSDRPQNQEPRPPASEAATPAAGLEPRAPTTGPTTGIAKTEPGAREHLALSLDVRSLVEVAFPDVRRPAEGPLAAARGSESGTRGGAETRPATTEPIAIEPAASQPSTAATTTAPGGMAVALDGHAFPDRMAAQGRGHATPERPVIEEFPPIWPEGDRRVPPDEEAVIPPSVAPVERAKPAEPAPPKPPPVFSVDEPPFTRRPAHAWPLPVDLSQPDPAPYGGMQTTVYAAVLKDHLARARDHFAEQGWLDRAFVYFDLPGTANPQAGDLAEVRQLAWLTHFVDGGLAFLSELIPQPMTPFGWFDYCYEDLTADIDIWATPARYEHPPTLRQLQVLGKRTWLLPDRPPFSGSMAVEAPPVHARSLPWQAFLQRHEAVYLPYATDWPDKLLDRPIEDPAQPSDTWLLYPGASFGLTEPVPSLRLKQLQLGIQDYQLLRVLETQGRGETARLLAGSLIKAAGTEACGDNYQDGLFGRRVDDPRTWEMARRLLIEEAAAALLEAPPEEKDRLALQTLWAEFLAATRRIETRIESARLLSDERPGRSGYLIRYEAAIRNELRTPVQGELTFGRLAPGLERVSDFVRIGPIPEMGMARSQLVVAIPVLPLTDLDGHFSQTIVFDAGTSGSESAEATLSIVQAPPAPRPIVIDGDLSDWPPNEFNIAGDFRLITAGGTETGGAAAVEAEDAPAGAKRPRRRAESQTIAYFCRDGDRLCIAVHAASPAAAGGMAVALDGHALPDSMAAQDRGHATAAPGMPLRNFVEYADLMPLGEDLVEIFIDPTNAATQSDDLYHIVLKSTGNPVFERGIGTTPPIGRCRPWPSIPPTCYVKPTSYGWCAEIAIPLSTFGAEARKNPVWGINLARLEPVRGEYSDWSRAPRYCYDPRTLGNLVWP